MLSNVNRSSLNVEGAFQHILNNLYAFIATAVVLLTGFPRADALAALVVATLPAKAGWGLVQEFCRPLTDLGPGDNRTLLTLNSMSDQHDARSGETSERRAQAGLLRGFPHVIGRDNTFSGPGGRAVQLAKGSIDCAVIGNTVTGRTRPYGIDRQSKPGFQESGNTSS